MPSVMLHLLGLPRVEREGAAVAPLRHKSLALLTYVALTRRRHERALLSGLLWPEHEPARARASLRTALWELLQVLGADVLEVERDTVALCDGAPVWVDVQRFEQLHAACAPRPESVLRQGREEALTEAAALYRGELLQGVRLKGCEDLEAWRQAQTAHLRSALGDVLRWLAEAHASQGRFALALPFARRRVACEPFDEQAHALVMRLLAWSGARAEALRHYEQLCATLSAELGVAPGEECARLHAELSQGHPPPAPGSREVRVSVPLPAELPAPVTALVGREPALALLARRLADPGCRVLTLTGPGGVGKTQLALEAARRHEPLCRDGARWVSLRAVAEPALLASAIADALALPPEGASPPLARLREHLRTRALLLVLDGAEHLAHAAAPLSELVEGAPGVQLLITSRERLDLRGEWAFPVGGLPCPAGVEETDAVALFVAAARRAVEGFTLLDEHRAGVARICRAVEGLPLGLELAAAWVRHFPPGEIAAQLERDLDFLAGPRDAPEQQRSLRASFTHSWRLLGEDERQALARLSVFHNPATLADVAEVTGASLAVLAPLLDKCLARRTPEGRYALHALIRQYAAEHLRAAPEEERRVHQRHARGYLAKVEHASGPGALERDDLRAAFRTAVAQGDWALLARTLAGYCDFHERLGHLQELEAALAEAAGAARRADVAPALSGRLLARQARCALELGALSRAEALAAEGLRALRVANAPRELGEALLTAGRVALLQGHPSAARWCFRGSLSLATARGDRHARATAMSHLAEVALLQGDAARARRLLGRGLGLLRLLGDPREVAAVLGTLGDILCREGDLEAARATFRDGLQLARKAANARGTALLLGQLGRALARGGEREEARRSHEEGLALARAASLPEAEAEALYGLGVLARLEERHGEARALLLEGLALRHRLGVRQGVAESLRELGRVAARTGELEEARRCFQAALDTALELGTASSALETLVDLATLRGPPPPGTPLWDGLAFLVTLPGLEAEARERARHLLGPGTGPLPARTRRPPPLSAVVARLVESLAASAPCHPGGHSGNIFQRSP
ncbi:ATP-binding protein [Corallococcus caeni]|uniref:BTAD domain-containing putative transcriptional regulator n=1 Tax=Corallococcus caeni TaxID=3082388 RepID=A0ABQ6QW01_9BACT|nr:BTAD domain-containing putative transcriptional regulator [Corallococcus sp. NO1]